jgi:hypothetical protein
MGPVLFFDPHNPAFRTVAQEQQWSLQYKMEMKILEIDMQKLL